jgi:hypothetical protein
VRIPLCSGEYAISTMSSSLIASSMPLRSGLLYVKLRGAVRGKVSWAERATWVGREGVGLSK